MKNSKQHPQNQKNALPPSLPLKQESALKRGVDVVVGTPGRVKDFLEKKTLKLSALRFRVLDEVDKMLEMGFVDDVELILGAVRCVCFEF